MLIKYNNYLLIHYIDHDEFEPIKFTICRNSKYKSIISIESEIYFSIEIKIFINNSQFITIHSAYNSDKYNYGCDPFYITIKPDLISEDDFINLKELGKYNNFKEFIYGFINANKI